MRGFVQCLQTWWRSRGGGIEDTLLGITKQVSCSNIDDIEHMGTKWGIFAENLTVDCFIVFDMGEVSGYHHHNEATFTDMHD